MSDHKNYEVGASYAQLADLLRDPAHRRIAVLAHVRPDGDAIGSQVAAAACLRDLGKEVIAINEDGVPETLAFLCAEVPVVTPDSPAAKEAAAAGIDLVLALDTSNRERLGAKTLALLAEVPLWVNVDHHISNERYGDIVHVDPSSPAVGQFIFDLFSDQDLPISSAARDALYVAISTDTGSFRYGNTTPGCLRAAARLIELEADGAALAREVYESYPARRLEATRELFSTLRMDGGGRIATWALSREAVDRLGIQSSDTEGLIDTLRSIREVLVAAHFEEMPDGKIRVSVRSKEGGVDVCAICSEFGGGGHRLASGVRMRGPLEEARTRFLQTAEEHLQRHLGSGPAG